jgi:hypothetical protein
MAKQYTQAQWARLQARLPEEDRVPYSESPDKPEPKPTATPTPSKKASAESGVIGAASISSQLTPQTIEAIQNVQSPAVEPKLYYNYYTGEWVDDPSKIKPREGMGGPESGGGTIQVSPPPGSAKTILSITYEGKGKNRVKITKYSDGTETRESAPEDEPDTSGYKLVNGVLYFNGQPFSGTYNGQTYENGTIKIVSPNNNTGYQVVNGKLYFNGQLFTGSFSGQTYENGTVKATTVANSNVMTAGQEDVYSIMVARLNQYNLGALAPLIRDLAIKGATEATIMLQLSEEPLYKERFKANEARKQKGLSVLTPSQYLSLEDDYRQVLRAYGLTQFDNDAYVSQFLANDVSVSELSNRVVTAVQRVRNADPAVSSMLKNLYGIGQNDLVAYVLDPQQQFQKIERQVAASEISVAAARQGFDIGATVAEQLAAQGISQAEAQRGYSTIADILPTAEKLSDIYGGVEEQYRLPEAEQEVFNQLASAQRKRQRLVSRETAAFSGASGLGRTSLTEATGGQF